MSTRPKSAIVDAIGASELRSVVEDYARDVDIAMDAIDTVRVIAMLGQKADGLSADDARTAFYRIEVLLDLLHNDLDVLQETMREAA